MNKFDKYLYEDNRIFFLKRYPKRLITCKKELIESENLIKIFLKKNNFNKLKNNSISPKIITIQNNKIITQDNIKIINNINELFLPEKLFSNLYQLNYIKLNSLQEIIYPNLLNHSDFLAIVKEQSGKSLSYMIPIYHLLLYKEPIFSIKENLSNKSYPIVLIIVPSVKIAIKRYNLSMMLLYETNIITSVIYENGEYNNYLLNLKDGCDVLIGTINSIKNCLENKLISLSYVKYLIIEGLDELIMMKNEKELFEIGKNYDLNNKYNLTTCFYTNTFDKDINNLINFFLKQNYFVFKTEDELKYIIFDKNKKQLNISQQFILVQSGLLQDKLHQLKNILDIINGKILIFVNKKIDLLHIKQYLNKKNFNIFLLDDLIQKKFFNNKQIFITSDIECQNNENFEKVDYVINFNLPISIYIYEFRIQKSKGRVISFYEPENEGIYQKISETIK